jgi:release factor glutamine methyltransferase
MQTIGDALKKINSRVEKLSETASLDGQLLLARVVDRPRSWVLAHPEKPLSEKFTKVLDVFTTRLEEGEPLPYILGSWEFFGLEFFVNPDVFIPRPETEMLVEKALSWLKSETKQICQVKEKESCKVDSTLRVLDLGTGTGCIANALAVNHPGLSITATDISAAALKIARINAKKYSVSIFIRFIKSDLFSNLRMLDKFHLIITNPPYIPMRVLRRLPVYGHEPSIALDGGRDGLAFIRRFLAEVPTHLIPGGLLLMEIEASEGQPVRQLAFQAFPNACIKLHKDLAGHDRMLEIQT